MIEKTKKRIKGEDHPDPHVHNPDAGLHHGVPENAATEESKGVPDSGRHRSETAAVAGLTSPAGGAQHR